jgi:hypothetical protein
MIDFEYWNISKLSVHGWQIITSFLTWTLVYYTVMFVYRNSKAFQILSKGKKSDFAVCHVSFCHSAIILLLAFPMLFDSVLLNDKIYGYTYYSGSVLAITTGYFLWDTIICVGSIRIQGYQFTFHALACLLIFILSFVSLISNLLKPIFNYFGALFLIYELSTPFLNIHLILDKLGLAGSIYQAVNGVFLLSSFFFARILFGYYNSFVFIKTIKDAGSSIPVHYLVIYGSANFLLNGLNAIWFTKMVRSVMSRFDGKRKSS